MRRAARATGLPSRQGRLQGRPGEGDARHEPPGLVLLGPAAGEGEEDRGGGEPGPARAGVASARQVGGKELSFNNIADADAAFELAAEFEQPACVVVKHLNPCGVGLAATLAEAHARAGRRLGVVERTPFSRQGGYEAGLRLLRRADRPTAVFVSSDSQAVGLLHAAHELGVAVPEEIAVGSFDDSEEARFCWPPLTTAQQPVRAMARAAIAAVLLNWFFNGARAADAEEIRRAAAAADSH